MKSFIRASSLLATVCLVSTAAIAADLDPVFSDDANMFRPAELGSGWYLRGELGANLNGRHNVFSTGTPANGNIYTDENFTDGFNYSVGVGKQLNDFIRLELNAGRVAGSDYSTSQRMYEVGTAPAGTDAGLIVNPTDANPCNGIGEFIDAAGNTYFADDFIENCVRTDAVEYDVVNMMANAYVDLPKVMGIQPFVGAGVGLGRISWREEVGRVDCTPQSADVRAEACQSYIPGQAAGINQPYSEPGVITDGVQYNLAYQLAVGFAVDVTDNMKVDAIYRYTNYGGEGMKGSGSELAAQGYDTHQVNVGLRYTLF